MSLYDHFVASAIAQELRLPNGHGGVGLGPGQGLAGSSVYGAVRHRSAELRALTHQLLAKGALGSVRLDANYKSREDKIRDASGKALLHQWAEFGQHRNPGARMDSLVPMASQGLTSFFAEVYEYGHSDLTAWNKEILDVDSSTVDPAAENYVWYEKDLVGTAQVGHTYSSQTVPLVAPPVAQSNFGIIVPALVGMETNFMDDRREALGVRNGKPDFQVQQAKAKTCMDTIAQFFNALWLYGDATLGVDGLWNNPTVSTITLTGGPWSGLTALQINDKLVQILNNIPNTTSGRLKDLKRITIFLPPDQYDRANSLPITAAGDKSVLKYFKENNGLRDDQVKKTWEFAASNSAIYNGGPNGLSSDRGLVVYKVGDMWDPKFILSQPIEMPAPPRQNGMGETVFYHARGGGMRVADAQRIKYIEGL